MRRQATPVPLLGLMCALAWASIPAGRAEAPEIHGFLQAHTAARLGGVDCTPGTVCDTPFNEQRLQLKVEGSGLEGSLGYAAKLDLLNDAALNDSDLDVRELYADYNTE